MSLPACMTSGADVPVATPDWLWPVLGTAAVAEGAHFTVRDERFVVRDGIPRSQRLVYGGAGTDQRHVRFQVAAARHLRLPGLAWPHARMADRALRRRRQRRVARRTRGSPAASSMPAAAPRCRRWNCSVEPVPRLRYLGVDVSAAVDVARQRFAERGISAAFLQADLSDLPLAEGSVDLMFSEGVLHHTDSTERALRCSLARLLEARRPLHVLRLPPQGAGARVHRRLRARDSCSRWLRSRPGRRWSR